MTKSIYNLMLSRIDHLKVYSKSEIKDLLEDTMVELEGIFPHHEVGPDVDMLTNRTLTFSSSLGFATSVSEVCNWALLYTDDASGIFSSRRSKLWVKSTASPGIRFQAAAHEVAHAVHSTYNPKLYRNKLPTVVKETIAHTVEFLVLYHYGIDTSFDSGLFIGAFWGGTDEDVAQQAPISAQIATQIVKFINRPKNTINYVGSNP